MDCQLLELWFWPTAGVLLFTVAIANFSQNGGIILAGQFYIAAFHSGAVFYHLILGHHPATGCAPGFFVAMAFFVIWIRTSIWLAIVGVFVSVLVAKGLSMILVRPPGSGDGAVSSSETHLLD